MYLIYWLISELIDKTYVGFTNDIKTRIKFHKTGRVKTTIDFGKCRYFILEKVLTLTEAREKEKYWKSATGRRKLKKLFGEIVNKPSSG